MHPSLAQLQAATIGTPFEGRLWIVGGAVRDEALGLPPSSDFDLVSELDVGPLATSLFEQGISAHAPVIYARFGTALVQIGDAQIELVTARRESYDASSRKPNVEPATLLEDAMRRDFTVNTLRRNLHTLERVDPTGRGLADLASKTLRTPTDPTVTFHDDPLRMLRAVRFRLKLGFTYADDLVAAMRASAPRLSVVSPERIRDELNKTLALPHPESGWRDLMDFGLLDQFAPEFRAMQGVEQGRFHHLDVWEHTLLVLSHVAGHGTTLGWAALLHDVGKPETRTVDADGATRFFGHEVVGASMARKLLNRLRFSGDEIDQIVSLVKNHMRLGSWTKLTDAAARRLMRDMGELLEPLLTLVEADAASLAPDVRTLDLSPLRAKLAEIQSRTPVETLQSPLTGQEIMTQLGLDAGPEVGEWKRALTEAVLDGVIAPGDKPAASAFLERHRSTQERR